MPVIMVTSGRRPNISVPGHMHLMLMFIGQSSSMDGSEQNNVTARDLTGRGGNPQAPVTLNKVLLFEMWPTY